MKNKRAFIEKNYKILKSIYIDNINNQPDDGFYSITDIDYGDTNPYWNHRVYLGSDISDSVFNETEDFFNKKGYKPTIYVDNIENINIPKDYNIFFQDSWMFWDGTYGLSSTDTELIEIQDFEDVKKFVDLFYRTHSDDLDDTYSGISDAYGKQLKKKYNSDNDVDHLNYYFIEYQGDIVGHRIIVILDDTAYLTTIGVIPERREEGIGTEAVQETIKHIKNNYSVDTIYFQTEKDTETERFFSDRGFNTEYVWTGLSKI